MKVVCVLLVALFAEAYCFSRGPPGIDDTTPVEITLIDGSTLMAPRGIVACDMMTPGHANVRPQNPNDNGGYFVNHDVPEGSYAASTPYNGEGISICPFVLSWFKKLSIFRIPKIIALISETHLFWCSLFRPHCS